MTSRASNFWTIRKILAGDGRLITKECKNKNVFIYVQVTHTFIFRKNLKLCSTLQNCSPSYQIHQSRCPYIMLQLLSRFLLGQKTDLNIKKIFLAAQLILLYAVHNEIHGTKPYKTAKSFIHAVRSQTSTLYLIQMRQLLNKVKELFTIKFIKFCILLSHLKLRRDISHAVNIAIVSIATRC